MRMSKKTAVASALAAGSLAATGVGVGVAATASTTHTLNFNLKQLNFHAFGKTAFVETQRATTNAGKFAGYDLVQGTYNSKTKVSKVDVSVGLKGGVLYLHFRQKGDAQTSTGSVTGGTGKYKGAKGTATVTFTSETKAKVTIRYHK